MLVTAGEAKQVESCGLRVERNKSPMVGRFFVFMVFFGLSFDHILISIASAMQVFFP